MVLSVIVPDDRAGMRNMLEHELSDIESEIIFDKWGKGLKRATGDFVCLLEHDSAVSRGSIARQLEPFLSNPRFRKLAMVSPLVEFEDTAPIALNGLGVTDCPRFAQLARSACVAGAIIRRTSLLQYTDLFARDLTVMSHQISVAFWENGLRVIAEPASVYYSPQNFRKGELISASAELLELWRRECVV